MESLSDLRRFCEYFIDKHGLPTGISEDEKAEAFRNVYLAKLPPNLKTLRAVANACGINISCLKGEKLPRNLRGYHDVFEGKRNIYYREGDSLSGIENTILHEIREMMEPIFTEICADYEPLKTLALHQSANRFASAVLLPGDSFKKKAFETGLDIIALAEHYRKSCFQVLLRLGEVLEGKLFFYGALYEINSRPGSDWKVTCWIGSRNNECQEANISGLYGFFPRKNHPVVSGSLVDMTIKTKKAHMVRHITVIDELEDEGLTAIAKPLFLKRPAWSKVALVILLQNDAIKLKSQIKNTKPVIIDSLYKRL